MANEVKIGFNLDLSKLPQQTEKARALIDKAISDAEKKIEDYQDRLKKGEGDTNFATKEADGIRKAISALEKQVEALKKITSIQSLKEDLASLNKEIEDFNKKGINKDTVARAVGLDEKIKTLSDARDAIVKEKQDELKTLEELRSERASLSKDLLNPDQKVQLKSELSGLKGGLGISKELKVSVEDARKLLQMLKEHRQAQDERMTADNVAEINQRKLDGVKSRIQYNQQKLQEAPSGEKKVYEGNLASLKEEEEHLQKVIDGWNLKREVAEKYLEATIPEFNRLLDLTKDLSVEEVGALGRGETSSNGALKEKISTIESLLANDEAARGSLIDLEKSIDDVSSSYENLLNKEQEVLKELSTAKVNREGLLISDDNVNAFNNTQELKLNTEKAIQEGNAAFRLIAEEAKDVSSDINNQIAADSQAAQDKLIDGFGQKVSKLSDMLSGELSLEDLTEAVELYNELTEEADKFAESSDDGDWDDRLDGWLNKLGSLKQKIDELYPELSKNLKHVENSEPVEETASTEEKKTAIVDVKSLQDVINKKKELAQEQREYVEELRVQRDLMAQEATSKGDFSGDTYKLLDLQLAQATDKMYDMELETEHLIEKAADFRRSLQEIDDANGIDELEESLDRLLETYG